MMKHKQKQPYGCGLYAVANACNLDNFITDERLEKSKNGNVIGQLLPSRCYVLGGLSALNII